MHLRYRSESANNDLTCRFRVSAAACRLTTLGRGSYPCTEGSQRLVAAPVSADEKPENLAGRRVVTGLLGSELTGLLEAGQGLFVPTEPEVGRARSM